MKKLYDTDQKQTQNDFSSVSKISKKLGNKHKIFDVIIIGGGPAGYTASIYTSRSGRKTVMFTGLLSGGQLMNTTLVENFPGFEKGIMGPQLMEQMKKQTERMGTELIYERIIRVDFKRIPFSVFTQKNEYQGKSIIITTGADYRKLDVKGEESFAGRGVSYCAVCDGPLFRGEEIAVIGGGDSAMEEALFLTQFAKTVQVIHWRDSLRASQIMQERALKNKKILFHWNSVVKEIRGDKKVNALLLNNNKTNTERTLKVGGVFIAIGYLPNTFLFKGHIDLDEKGYIVLTHHTQTSVKGVFAAGDVHDHLYRQAVTAAGFGCMAAIDAEAYLSTGH